jgi:hypothetical protein
MAIALAHLAPNMFGNVATGLLVVGCFFSVRRKFCRDSKHRQMLLQVTNILKNQKSEIVRSDASAGEDRRNVIPIKPGKVSEEQCKMLMDHYGSQAFVPFNPAREYELHDFLPPKV